jgi:hypothetical protein
LLFANHTHFHCYLIGMVVDNNRSTCFCISLTSVALSEIQDPLKVRHSSGCLAVLTLTKTRFFPRTVADWNSLSDFARSRSSVDAFRDALSSDLAQPPGCC